MPNTPAAKKSLRQNKKRNERNKRQKKNMRDKIKEYNKAIESENMEKAEEMLPEIQKTIDKMAKVNQIHKNKAARMKSKLSRKLEK